MEKLYEQLKENIEENLKPLAKKADLTSSDLATMKEALCALKEIKMLEEGPMPEEDPGSSGYYYPRSNPMWHGSFGPNVHGNMTARSSYTNSPEYMRRNYNMGSSGHSIEDRIIAHLESLYDEMPGDHEQKVLDKWISRIRNDVG